MTIALALGSNLGDRRRNLRRAIGEIRRLPRTRLLRVSSIYESSPVGVKRQSAYLNCCLQIRTGLSPMGLLVELKRIEALLGRRPSPRWASRPLDIDILFYGRRRIRSKFLEIPHPRVFRRRFVLAPLAELSPRFKTGLFRLNAPSQKCYPVSSSVHRVNPKEESHRGQ